MEFTIVPLGEKKALRRKFIDKFIDTEKEHYKKYISTLREYPDGMCYTGYLWDCLKADYKVVERNMEQAISYLLPKGNVFVMWDIFSKKRVFHNSKLSNNYAKDTVISVDSSELCKFIQSEWMDYFLNNIYLPEDIYVFDKSMEWYVIFTHEGYEKFIKPELGEDDYIRICFVYETDK